jgi:hypothetical protein
MKFSKELLNFLEDFYTIDIALKLVIFIISTGHSYFSNLLASGEPKNSRETIEYGRKSQHAYLRESAISDIPYVHQ